MDSTQPPLKTEVEFYVNLKFDKSPVMKIYVTGNLLIKNDNLPLKLIPQLKKAFPKYEILEIDPNEDFIPEENSIIIDTVVGIDQVTLFTDLDHFADHKLISPHNYDLGLHLKLLKKIGKIGKLKIIGVPQTCSKIHAFKGIAKTLKILKSKA